MYSDASNFVKNVDQAFLFIMGVSIVLLLGLTIVLIYFIIRYNSKRNPVPTQIHGNNKLEIIWTVVPFIIVMVMFYYGWRAWFPEHMKAPKNSMKIQAIGRMWNWGFKYANGRSTDTLFVPVGDPVKLDLKSLDVIHSLYIPAFRIKQDVVPGKKGDMWFIAEKPGTYDLFCAEYCGLRHSYMITAVVAMEKSAFKKWYADTTTKVAVAPGNPSFAGLGILKKTGCLACHSTDGSRLVGPSYKGLYGSKVKVTENGVEKEITADDAYIKRSILDPNADIVDGFNKGMMLSYKDLLTDEEIKQIIEYMKTLK